MSLCFGPPIYDAGYEVHPGVNVRPICGVLLRKRQGGGGHVIIENPPEAEIQSRCFCAEGENKPVYDIQRCHPQPKRRLLWMGKYKFTYTGFTLGGAGFLHTSNNQFCLYRSQQGHYWFQL